ncbi:division/cell wall cluster transcriptional repressor MraZ [Shewanella intestini]|uniref:Transcriptional regulator MraZ n=1 Tax=Shewanella intestini TaxID=2017544 RepID=A0ABS5I6Q9_9GAMM|nr:division/cell wall cluster transcriptional repressor MraZ [Shewanella sp. XMDDZSB0408]MBR9729055.1 division/cell wall cluster transcriptional repressor MraZ [Shewanella intestini]MRG37131.1 division/cell wall cluster transcriptional repressor MraZ [Shewanella sp. XMDDZSB0408]
MLRGASAINMDAKGRIAIPARFRESLRSQHEGIVVVTVDISEQCLLIYPLHEWELIENKLKQLSDTNPAERMFKRKLLGYAQDCELDSHSRIVIPSALRQYANLVKPTMLVGLSNKFELWEQAAWQQKLDDDNALIQQLELTDNPRLADFSL